MAILFAGGEDTDFTLPIVGFRTETNTSRRRPEYARYAINPNYYADAGNGLLGYCYGSLAQPVQSLWFSVRAAFPLTWTDPKDMIAFFSNDGKPRLGLRSIGSNSIAFVSYNDAGNATQIAATDANVLPVFTTSRYDLQIVTGDSGRIRFYHSGALVLSYDGPISLGSATNLTRFGFQSIRSGSDSYYSEFLAATADTRLMEVRTHTLDGPGTHSEWAGDASMISETVANGSSFMHANTANAVNTFTISDLPPANFEVLAVVASARVARGEEGPENAALVVRTNGTTLEANAIAVDGGWQRTSNIWDKNPQTGATWTAAQFNAIEVGIKTKP